MRDELIKVFNDTESFICENDYLEQSLKESKKKTTVVLGMHIPKKDETTKYLNNVFVTQSKSFEAARRLSKAYPGKRIAVLNFASATNPGGGVKKGSTAQEEDLCRCSTLYHCLAQNSVFNEFYTPNREAVDRTSLHTDDIVYSPDIIICKDDNTYARLDPKDFIKVDVLSCAAPNLREHTSNQYNPGEKPPVVISDQDLLELHKNRARNIFEVAKAHSVDILVLGAFGCGAFRNSPQIVAKAYKDVLQEYAKDFTEIEFAIFCKGSKDNFEVFSKELGE